MNIASGQQISSKSYLAACKFPSSATSFHHVQCLLELCLFAIPKTWTFGFPVRDAPKRTLQ